LLLDENGRGYSLCLARGEDVIAVQFDKKKENPDYLHHCSTAKAIIAEFPRKRGEDITESSEIY